MAEAEGSNQMFRRFLFWIIGVPVAAAVIALSVANRHVVTFSFDPANSKTPFLAFEIPLYLVIFAALFIGLLLGWAVTWAGQHRWRAKAASIEHEASILKREADEHKKQNDPFSSPALPRY